MRLFPAPFSGSFVYTHTFSKATKQLSSLSLRVFYSFFAPSHSDGDESAM